MVDAIMVSAELCVPKVDVVVPRGTVAVVTGLVVVELGYSVMQCLSPLNLPKPNGLSARDRIQVPCGRCVACKSNYTADWSVRLKEELRHSVSATFVTMTYNDSTLNLKNGKPTLVKRDCQLFLKRLRKNNPGKLKYYLVGEYGAETERPHYHMLLFGLTGTKDEKLVKLLKSWQKGMVHIGDVNSKSIAYTLKYMVKSIGQNYENEKPFALISRRPAIGSEYITKRGSYHEGNVDNMKFVDTDGVTRKLPRYYREKLYTKEEREVYSKRMASEFLDKEYEKQKNDDNYFSNQVDEKEAYKRRKLKNHKKDKL